MRRREFIAALGGAAVWPLVARAQQKAMPVIGFLGIGSPEKYASLLAAFRHGLNETGYVEGGNVVIEYRWAHDQFDQLPALAAQLLDRPVDVIVALGSVFAAKAATATIPIVTAVASDPVAAGLVASLNRPGGNVTGVNMLTYSLGTKRFELLRETVPNTKVIAVLVNPTNPSPGSAAATKDVEAAARAVGQQISVLNAGSERDFEPAFATLVEQGAGALLVMADPIFDFYREKLVALAARHAVPAIYEWSEFAALGGLMSYGSSNTDAHRRVGIYTGKILMGAKPADMPIDQAVKIELVLNLKTAKALGVTFPLPLLGRADEVIE
jgi:putative tryptophan/tyrosine transport system substrate-binding protein